jgi:DNA-binding MarR family transcriptional regulator
MSNQSIANQRMTSEARQNRQVSGGSTNPSTGDRMSRQPFTDHAPCANGPFRDFVTGLMLNSQLGADAAGLGPTDVYTLNLLATVGPLTAGQLADRTGLTTGAVTRLIDRLERAGHVRRLPDPVDRRRVHVAIEPDQGTVFDALLQPVCHRLDEIFESLSAEQRDVLATFFARAAPALREAAELTRAGMRQPVAADQVVAVADQA